jgi:hypothetical protein
MPPTNDDFANAIDLGSATSGSTTGTNVAATAESGEAIPTHGPGDGPWRTVWWKWTAPSGVLLATFSTQGSRRTGGTVGLDTALGIYTGSAVNALTEIASNDDYAPFTGLDNFNSQVTFFVVTGTTYYVQVSGYDNTEQGDVALAWSTIAGSLGTSTTPCPVDLCADPPSVGSENFGDFGGCMTVDHWYLHHRDSGSVDIIRLDYPAGDNETVEYVGYSDGQHYIWCPQTDGTSLYWIEQDPFDTNSAKVRAATLGGGTPSDLYTVASAFLLDVHSLAYHPTTGKLYFIHTIDNGDDTLDQTLYSLHTDGSNLTSLYAVAGVDRFGGEELDPGGALPAVTATSIWGTTYADTPFNGVHHQLWRFDVLSETMNFGLPLQPSNSGLSGLVGTPAGTVITSFGDLGSTLYEVADDFSLAEWVCTGPPTSINGRWSAWTSDLSKITFAAVGEIWEFAPRSFMQARVGRTYISA